MHTIVQNIEQFNHYFHQPTYHPLVSVANLANADLSLFEPTDFNMYCVVLMEADFGALKLKNTVMHYRAGTMFTMKARDVVSMILDDNPKPRGWMLAFRPELLSGTGLSRDFYMFNFFDYDVADALELYDSERHAALNCFSNINTELQAKDDEFTNHMLRLGIGTLLTFCRRFYERQFDTMDKKPNSFIDQLDTVINSYLNEGSDLPKRHGQITVAWCAEQFNLSASYFGDMVHKALGTTAQQYIQSKVIDKAKSLLANPDLSINDIAYSLGFDYPNHFSRFFRDRTGMSPTVFRRKLY